MQAKGIVHKNKAIQRAAWWAMFLMLLLVGDRLLARGFGQLTLHSQMRFSRLYRGGLEYQAVVLGNSRGVNSFFAPAMSAQTKLSTFNISYNGLSMHLAGVLMKDYCQHNRPPRLLLMEVSNVFDADDAAINDLRLYAAYSPGLQSAEIQRLPSSARATRLTHLWAYNNEMFYRALFYLRKSDQGWINVNCVTPELAAQASQSPPIMLSIHPQSLAALQTCLAQMERNGTEVRLVLAPYLPAYAARHVNLDAAVRELESKLGGRYKVWDYSRQIQDNSSFADRVHLNAQGSRQLLNRMMQDGLFALDANRVNRID